ncbi:pyridoxamine 5'-phosphate oxidase [Rufibacter sp. LB8]|uniref:pyridoxamine 5'-phosphate oxidase n=1 Tax=Rufibacter sp. LB8 TaxID=2777781 RepID=UPI00178C1AE9|nr:pyridoxamine 5'-phosphate oxidase [Rufibacter sp. LB8]
MEKPLSLADIRINYCLKELTRQSVQANPLRQFDAWLQEALAAKADEPTAMTVSTCDLQGKPSARVVLLKELSAEGFVFYTNYQSRKGQQLAQNPYAAITFFWPVLERQVRIEGVVKQVSGEISDAYFQSRPKGSQIGAWASPQSQEINGREVLETLEQEMQQKFIADEVLPRPAHWGGYVVIPERLEFWQGRPNRLHDRLEYVKDQNGTDWKIKRLAP